MDHGGCCNCFVCKIGKSLGLIEECSTKDCCKTSPKKVAKKKTTKKAKKK